MNSKLLIDTSVIVDFLRSKEKHSALLYQLANTHHLAISLITHTELYAGKSVWEKPKARKELERLLSIFEIMPLTQDISKKAGQIRSKHGVDLIDALIAATASEFRLPLQTTNRRHFEKIEGVILASSAD
jgi:tRNA(fMet)-specific endonuclease VapC